MRKIWLVPVLALSLAGCATAQQVATVVTAATVGVKNPVTKKALYNFENGMIVAFAGLNAYKQTCQKGLIDQSCRQTIAELQVYTRQLPDDLAKVRVFVKQNDQVNAVVAFDLLQSLFANFKAAAAARNVKVS